MIFAVLYKTCLGCGKTDVHATMMPREKSKAQLFGIGTGEGTSSCCMRGTKSRMRIVDAEGELVIWGEAEL